MSQVQLTVIDRDNQTKDVTAEPGVLLMNVLREQVDLTIGTCGGAISCGTCLVTLSPEWAASLPAASEDEAEMLEALEAVPGARLSCQICVTPAAAGAQAALVPAE